VDYNFITLEGLLTWRISSQVAIVSLDALSRPPMYMENSLQLVLFQLWDVVIYLL